MNDKPLTPGRPRSFDTDAAIDAIVPVFFENGFKGTSLPQLEAATGLHRQSMRYAFGGKQELFLASIQRYGETKLSEIRSILTNADRGVEGIRGVFDMWLRDLTRDTCRGCFLVTTSSDRTLATDTKVLAAINRTNQQIISLLEAQFKAARLEGDVSSALSDRELAQQMLTLGDGAMALCQLPEARVAASAIFAGFCAQIRN
ncbi:TetR family transcriptional regulator [Roseibium sp. HPY-6]|uniref:TetR/AcrR family transcriptional regulator n=1 Tax=Roseibium sp. HPY-6 TaxID=3229852 RepID=UPI0033901DC7